MSRKNTRRSMSRAGKRMLGRERRYYGMSFEGSESGENKENNKEPKFRKIAGESLNAHNKKVLIARAIKLFGLSAVDEHDFDRTFSENFGDNFVYSREIYTNTHAKQVIAHYTELKIPNIARKNFEFLEQKMEFSKAECAILHYCFTNENVLENLQLDEHMRLISALYGVSYGAISRTLKNDDCHLYRLNLIKQDDILEADFVRILTSEGRSFLLSELSENRLLNQFGNRPKASKLDLKDFKYMDEKISMLLDFSRKKCEQFRGVGTSNKASNYASNIQSSRPNIAPKDGASILLYGEPGVGKNEIVNVIAKVLQCEIVCVATPSSGRYDSDRLGGFKTLQYAINPARHIVCFDEVESILCVPFCFNKADINWALENTRGLNFFLSNSAAMDPAFVRRFDIVMEIKAPPKAKKREIIKRLIGGGVKLDSALLEKIVDNDCLTQGVLTTALKTAKMFPKERAQSAFVKCLNENLRARGEKPILLKNNAGKMPYDMSLIECSTDVVALAEQIKTRCKKSDESVEFDEDFEMCERLGNCAKNRAENDGIRILCYGIPGSGKSEFVKELSKLTGIELLSKKASDLFGMFVGQTEANIAAAFKEARRSGKILHIDEVDSFLYEREGASHSWERSFVNEMLTQMESFEGVFVATSNHLKMMDSAVLRRFDSKIEFRALSSEKLGKAFVLYSEFLGLGERVESSILSQLKKIKNAAFGDFALIAREARFVPIKTQKELLEKLKYECSLKGDSPAPLGFV